MSTDRPDWFGTGEPSRDPDLGSETDRTWFEDLGFERTTPGTRSDDRSDGGAWAVAGAPDQQDRPGVGDVDDPTAGTGAPDVTEQEADADGTSPEGDGGLFAWLKSLLGF